MGCASGHLIFVTCITPRTLSNYRGSMQGRAVPFLNSTESCLKARRNGGGLGFRCFSAR
jgi:hypothetical protein